MKRILILLTVAALCLSTLPQAEAGCLFKGRLRNGARAGARAVGSKARNLVRVVLPPYGQ
jgi:hypothetical protein